MTRVEQARPQASVCELGLPYRTDHVWSVARLVALARDEFTCVLCGATDYEAELHVHHVTPCESYGPSCEHHVDGLVTLCAAEHRDLHRWLRAGCPAEQLALAV